ncbi:hypothetical protein T265_14037, partial [Opisthorchis viverrini]
MLGNAVVCIRPLSTSLNRITVLESFSLFAANGMVKEVCTNRSPYAH